MLQNSKYEQSTSPSSSTAGAEIQITQILFCRTRKVGCVVPPHLLEYRLYFGVINLVTQNTSNHFETLVNKMKKKKNAGEKIPSHLGDN